ncbi:hypothetical protein VPHG_00002 [Vibrio phage 11895-B1]|uniref:hypothetical protein n=1 Tax=Vibrio phage 11895-B1 TaxID=754075 RepID=UPI0002C05611|nr:hypothetical protein VPHG_00002 [Vibrio phage 11895-B1]AGH32069.1 hypothetical protein VPHG_00002 [Vibrio phage 11895-B1]
MATINDAVWAENGMVIAVMNCYNNLKLLPVEDLSKVDLFCVVSEEKPYNLYKTSLDNLLTGYCGLPEYKEKDTTIVRVGDFDYKVLISDIKTYLDTITKGKAMNLTREDVIRILYSQQVYDAMNLSEYWIREEDRQPTIYEILGVLGVSREEFPE